MQTVDLDRILQAHRTYADLAGAFADLRTQQGAQAALALTIASSYALDVVARLTRANPPDIEDAIRAAAAGGLPLGTPKPASNGTTAKSSPDDGTIDSAEVARRLDLHIETLREMSRTGRVPARKVGRSYRYHWPTICEWLRGDGARSRGTEAPSSPAALGAASRTKKPDVYAALRALQKQRGRRRGRHADGVSGNDPSTHNAGSKADSGTACKAEPPVMERLTQATCEALTRRGIHQDGGGLCLWLKGQSRTWVFRYSPPGRAVRVDRCLQLGSFPAVSLTEARHRAAEARALIAHGIDPIERRRAEEERQRKANERNERDRTTATDHAM